MEYPLVSIVIPVYNGSAYMREAIDSALSQTYSNIEVIVVNDGSNDEGKTEKIALSYGNKIRYFVKENGGVSSALNLGIKKMRGVYFSWLSHDDVYSPDKIKHQVELLMQFGNTELIALCGNRQINKDSVFLSQLRNRRFDSVRVSWSTVLMETLKNGAFNGCAFLIPKSVFEKVGGFHEGLRYSQDALMWMQIFSEKYELVFDETADVYSRVHEAQLTQRGRVLFLSDSMVVGDIMISKLAELSKKETDFLYAFANRNALHGNKKLVDNCIKASKEFLPFSALKVWRLKWLLLYGKFRPFLRKFYYRFIQKASA